MKQTHLLPFLVLFLVSSLHAEPLTLVKDGQPNAVIVVPGAPNAPALVGAQELQLHLKKITGADVPIVSDRETIETGKVRIMVGDSRATRALGVSSAGYDDQEYSLQQKENAIILLGYDVNEDYPAVAGGTATPYAKGRFGGAMTGWCSVGVKDHGFNDDRGTMECFVYVAPSTNEPSTGWMILRVGDEQNGHILMTRKDEATKQNYLSYETYVGGQANKVEAKQPWWDRKPGWHHVMATWDATLNTMELFLNGKSVGTAPYAKTACNKAPFFSVRGDGNNIPNCFGPIDEVRLSKVVRVPVVPAKAHTTDDDTLALLHFDEPYNLAREDSDAQRADPNAVIAQWVATNPENYGNLPGLRPASAGGSVYAVYDFLEKCCGIRWYAPTDEGMVCPKTKTLTVTVKSVRRQPAFLSRMATGLPGPWGMVFLDPGQYYRHPEATGPDLNVLRSYVNREAMRQFGPRLKAGGKGWLLTHTFEAWPDRFWEKNPNNPDAFEERREDYFFVRPDGSRSPEQLCFSSPGALEQVIKDARAYFDEGKMTARAVAREDWYAVGPRDTGLWGCSCPDCTKGYAAAGTNWPDTFNNGKASEIYYAFLNKVQAAIDQSNPGKHIASFNYMDYVCYPKTLTVNTNIYCGFAECFGSGTEPVWAKRMMDYYTPWRERMPGRNQICIWRYDGWDWEFSLRNGPCFPKWYPAQLTRTLRMYAKDGARGLFYCGINNYIDGWLNYKLLDDPELDVDAELDYFFTHYYGAAGEPMQKIYQGITNRFADVTCAPEGVSEWFWKARPPFMENIGKLIEEAKTKADSELAKNHVAAFERDVWQGLMLPGYNGFLAAQPGKKHPYPWVPPVPVVAERGLHSGAPSFTKTAFFRSGGPGIGIYETGFDDRQGTMEAWVQVGGVNTSGFWHGYGVLFNIERYDGASGHRVYLKPDFTKNVLVPTYETWAAGKTNVVRGAPIPPPTTDSRWYHVSAEWGIESSNKTYMALFINGKRSGRAAPYRPTQCQGAPFMAGNPVKGMGCFGAIDEIRLSNVVRKPALQTEPYQTDKNTLLLIHFDDAPGAVATDTSKSTALAKE